MCSLDTYFFVCVWYAGLSLLWPLPLWSTGSGRAGSVAMAQGLAALWHVGSSQTGARTRVPCIGRRTLNHCATREARTTLFELWFSQGICPVAGLLGRMVVLFVVFKGTSILFSIVAVSIYIPTSSARGFPFLHTLSSICCF